MSTSDYSNDLEPFTDAYADVDGVFSQGGGVPGIKSTISVLSVYITQISNFLRAVIAKLQVNSTPLDANARQLLWVLWSQLIAAGPPQFLT